MLDSINPCFVCLAGNALPVTGDPSGIDGISPATVISLFDPAKPATVIVLASCGNGRIDPGEQCDNAAGNSTNPNAACRPDCTVGRCGDGIADTPLEVCDDGALNGQTGSKCDSQCRRAYDIGQVLPGSVIGLPSTSGGPQPGNNTNSGPEYDSAIIPASGNAVPPATTESGPETLLLMAAGASAGYAWMRRRNRGNKDR